MELALPFIALSSMYVILKNKKEKAKEKEVKELKEAFNNMGINNNYLPNVNTPPQNFPINNMDQIVDTVQQYSNPNQSTSAYLNQNEFENRVRNGESVGQNPQQIYSLTGNYLQSEQFMHNNMNPFNGGKIKGNTYHCDTAETVLDNMVGSGTQIVKKIEQAPLFKPQADMQWAYGTPNQSDFYQSRVVPGTRANNIKPFESEIVGPGLDKGYCATGSGGYNSGMEARDKWLPKTVDQLRVDTNPKLEYNLIDHEGPANSNIKVPANVYNLGRVEKQRPDGFYIQTQDRWLTTTGSEKGERQRPIEDLGIINRSDCATDFMGPAGAIDRKAPTAPENYEDSRRQQMPQLPVNHSTAAGRGDCNDRLIQSHTNYENNRSDNMTQINSIGGFFSGAIGAVIAPFTDILRPSRKEECVNNVRIYGEIGTSVPRTYVNNPYNTPKTTSAETTLYAPQFNINNQKEGQYVNNHMAPDINQRNTSNCSNIGIAGGVGPGAPSSYEAAYNQHNNDNKSSTIANHPNPGGTQIFNQQMHVQMNKCDTTTQDGRMNPAYSRISGQPPSTSTYGAVTAPQKYNESAGCERNQSEILDAFKSNPYTHSLTGVGFR